MHKLSKNLENLGFINCAGNVYRPRVYGGHFALSEQLAYSDVRLHFRPGV